MAVHSPATLPPRSPSPASPCTNTHDLELARALRAEQHLDPQRSGRRQKETAAATKKEEKAVFFSSLQNSAIDCTICKLAVPIPQSNRRDLCTSVRLLRQPALPPTSFEPSATCTVLFKMLSSCFALHRCSPPLCQQQQGAGGLGGPPSPGSRCSTCNMCAECAAYDLGVHTRSHLVSCVLQCLLKSRPPDTRIPRETPICWNIKRNFLSHWKK